ncbi:MAG: YcgL domain-containing protein [Pseudomonas sp.]
MKRICSIYKSPKRNEMYLYVHKPIEKRDALKKIPASLLLAFGTPIHAFDLVLSPERALAREDIHQVLANLESQGYHLQMPPPEDEYIEHLPEELLRRNDPL